MGKVILGTTLSLDGFINDRNGSVEALYTDLANWRESELGKESIQNTGAVVMGRNTFNMSEDPDWFAGNYEYQVPIFVLTHHVPKKKPKETGQLTFTFVTDGLESAIRQAKEAAGERDVNIIGAANTAQQCLRVGLADELQVDIMPVLLGGGMRLFEHLGETQIRLERIKVMELPGGRTHLRFRFVR
ncbi:MAG: dihydrofolate reductase [Chloroflexi bacterium]|nr:dihydrofolate reductase [Chloroflexota bacterium]MDL1941137.1 dihydrofolate reductase [Chloroflexi bacterium CFX2]